MLIKLMSNNSLAKIILFIITLFLIILGLFGLLYRSSGEDIENKKDNLSYEQYPQENNFIGSQNSDVQITYFFSDMGFSTSEETTDVIEFETQTFPYLINLARENSIGLKISLYKGYYSHHSFQRSNNAIMCASEQDKTFEFLNLLFSIRNINYNTTNSYNLFDRLYLNNFSEFKEIEDFDLETFQKCYDKRSQIDRWDVEFMDHRLGGDKFFEFNFEKPNSGIPSVVRINNDPETDMYWPSIEEIDNYLK